MQPDGRRLADDVVFIGERAVLFPDRRAVLSGVEAPYPSSTDGGPLRLEDELPAALRVRPGGAPGFVHGSVQLGDGEDVLIWDGQGYERRGSGWERTFATDLRAASGLSWTSAPAGDDGFYYLSDRQLYEVHRGSPPVRVLPTVDNIMDVRPGPGASLILRQGQNKQGHLGRLYFPGEHRHATIAPKDFGHAMHSGPASPAPVHRHTVPKPPLPSSSPSTYLAPVSGLLIVRAAVRVAMGGAHATASSCPPAA